MFAAGGRSERRTLQYLRCDVPRAVCSLSSIRWAGERRGLAEGGASWEQVTIK